MARRCPGKSRDPYLANLTKGKVESFTRIPGSQTAFLDSDYETLETLAAEDEMEFLVSIK